MQLVFEILENLLYHKANEINLCFLLFTSDFNLELSFGTGFLIQCQKKKLSKFADKQ